jgi:anthranilate phosphoribosyltransferase
VPTAFNVLGPLANPARVARQVVGVADPAVAERMLRVLADHGSEHVVIVHGADGLDELTTTGPSTMHELRDGETTTSTVDPATFGLPLTTPDQLRGGGPDDNAAFARGVLGGQRGAHRDIVLLNAGAGLYVGGRVGSLAEGVAVAGDVIDDGDAERALERLVRVSAAVAEADTP